LEIGVVVRRGNWLGEDSGGSLDGGDMGNSIGDGDDASKEGGMRRRLMSSSPSLSSSASHCLFLVCLAGGEIGGGGSFEGWSLAVGAMTDGGGQVAMAAEGHRWRWR
jgi:hypothetical protein